MSSFDALPPSLRPLAFPFISVVVLLAVSLFSFSQRVVVPPDPDTLFMQRVQIDDVRHTLVPAGDRGPNQRISVPVRLATSEAWPGLTFRFSGAASGVSIIPPAVFDLYTAKNPSEEAARHTQYPNVFPSLEVYGVAENGQLLVDPSARYESRLGEQRRHTFIGWGALFLAFAPGFLLARQLAQLWREHVS